MIRWLKWLIAGRELVELERWRTCCQEAERWLAEFDDARHALEYVRGMSEGEACDHIAWVRERMRQRRVSVSVKVHAHRVGTRAPVTDWDVAQATEQAPGSGIAYRFLGVTGEEDA